MQSIWIHQTWMFSFIIDFWRLNWHGNFLLLHGSILLDGKSIFDQILNDDAYPEYGFIMWREIFNIYTVIHFDQQDPEASEDDQIAYYAESKPIQSRWKKTTEYELLKYSEQLA